MRLLSSCFLTALLAFSPALAEQPSQDKDPCKGEKTVLGCYNKLLAEALERVKKDRDNAKTPDENAIRSTIRTQHMRQVETGILEKATPSIDSGSASAITDLASPFLLGLSFAGVSEKNDGNTLNVRFNTLRKGHFKISFSAEIKEAEVFKPLLDNFPKKDQDAKKKELTKGIGDFGNAKFTVKFALERKLGESRYFGRNLADYVDLFGNFFDQAVVLNQLKKNPEEEEVGLIPASALNPENTASIKMAVHKRAAVEQSIDQQLVDADYARITDLINNQPQFIISVDFLERDGAAGPDELSYEVRYEHGFRNVNSFLSSADDGCIIPVVVKEMNDKREEVDVKKRWIGLNCLGSYFEKHSKEVLNAHRLSFSLKYTDTEAFSFPISNDEAFTLEDSRKWVGEASYGRVLRFDANNKDQARFDLKAEYQDVEGDPKLQSRFVATATYTEKLPGNFSVSLSAVYANKPEYRGEVDEEVSARFGLKWNVAKPK